MSFRNIAVVIPLALFFAACDGNHVVIDTTDPDIVTVGPLGLSERTILAEPDGQNLRITFPFMNSGSSKIRIKAAVTLRALDDTFTVTGSADQTIGASGGDVAVSVQAPGGLDDPAARALLVIEYSFDTSVGRLSGVRSLHAAVGIPELVIIAPGEMEAGNETVVKAFVRNSVSGKAFVCRTVNVSMVGEDKTMDFSAVTDDLGAASVKVGLDEPGQYSLVASVQAGDGDIGADITRSCNVVRTHKVLVTTDKPMYQPGQLMLVRVLALKKPRLVPEADAEAVIEIFDGKGNKVFGKVETTGEFGVADAEFQLATQINMGTYRIKVTIGDTVTEKSVTVGRYNLPKFNVKTDLDRKWYLVGQTIKGTVNASYFFGKPVAGGSVVVTGSAYDVEFTPFGTTSGTTDAEGLWAFSLKLPNYMVGQDLEQGKALVRISIEVTDTAGQQVTKEMGLTVAKDSLLVSVIPESGTPVANMVNRFFVFTEAPDGSPVSADVTVEWGEGEGQSTLVETDDDGMAAFELEVPSTGLDISASASQDSGDTGFAEYSFKPGAVGGSLLVRTDRPIYEVGDTAVVTMISPDKMDRVYLDVLRAGQVVLEKSTDLIDSKAELEIDLDQEMSGDIVFSAYYMGADGTIVRDEKTVFVRRADSLNIVVTPDSETYEPGQQASVGLKVTDRRGNPVRSALGVQIVDEAVYALTEMKPGLLETYFSLEKAITEPKFEVHGVSFDVAGIVTDPVDQDNPEEVERNEKEAAAAFAAMGDSGLTSAVSSSSVVATVAKAALVPYYRQAVDDMTQVLADMFMDGYENESRVMEYIVNEFEHVDFFGNLWRFSALNDYEFKVTTIGADEIADTDDDWSQTMSLYDVIWGRYWEDETNMGGWADAAVAMDSGAVPEEGVDEEGSPRLRSWFPETLLWNPLLITDADGNAELNFTMADSITQWRMTSLAHSMDGKLGSSADGLIVFKEFFVDLDLPVAMTRKDMVEFPIAVYNYLDSPQTVALEITVGDWATLGGGGSVLVELEPNQVKGVGISLTAEKVGWHPITVTAIGEGGASDAVQRLVEVVPDGVEIRESFSGRLDSLIEKTLSYPVEAIEGTSDLLVKVYPGIMAQVVEGLDSILQMPSGCFEQTTASLWPDVLVLKYVQESGSITPEIELKAREFVNLGYQRLLTYECTGGGFTWFGDPDPANVILSSLGVLEFVDIAAVQEIDQTLIPRTVTWLKSRQAGDGSWHEEQGSEFATVRYDDLMTTCLATWALGQADTAPSSAISYIAANLDDQVSTYALSLCAAALTVAAPEHSSTSFAVGELLSRVEDDGSVAWWSAGVDSSQYMYGEQGEGTGNIEVTAMAVLALMKAAADPITVTMAIDWMASQKDSFGNWGTTHATIQALRAFVASLSARGSSATGNITVNVNGRDLDPIAVTLENSDVFFQFELKNDILPASENSLAVGFAGDGALMYSIVQSWWVPSGTVTDPGAEGPLTIDVEYEKSSLTVDSTIGATVTVNNVSGATLSMIMVDIGLPPGFDFMPAGTGEPPADGVTLDQAVEEGLVSRYETTARQVLVYISEMQPGQTLVLNWGLRARYPMDVKCPDSGAYLYYDESGTTVTSGCGQLVVTE